MSAAARFREVMRAWVRVIASGLLLAGVAAALGLSTGSAEASSATAAKFQPRPPEIRWRPDMAAARDYARARQGDIRFAVVDLRGKLDQAAAADRSVR